MRETIGGYRILNEIGSGGFGAVYRARDPLRDRDVALKALTKITDSNGLERFRREARLAYEIDHPNVIDILHYGEDGGARFIVMELMPISLREILRNGRLSLSRSVDICRQAALGLRAAHERGVIHRDVKPDNILIDSAGAVKVTDFGLARAEDLRTITVTGSLIGTPLYMSPEQWKGERPDVRSDIYSLGVVLHETLTGEAPFLIAGKAPVKQIRPSVPTGLKRIVEKCTELDPKRRYQTMDELIGSISAELVNRCALIDFYEATNGDRWERNYNWLTDAPLGDWYGAFLNHDGVVDGLSLESNNLEGEIPPEIVHLTELRTVHLTRNRLTGSIPTELGNLTKLEYIEIADNSLSGSIPPELSNLAKLEYLIFEGNRLSGSIPPELGSLTELKMLALASNGLLGNIPPELGDLTKLEWFSLNRNRLSGNIPPELGNLTELTELYLADNRLLGNIPPELGNLTKLACLRLDDNHLSGSIPPELGSLVELRDINIGENEINGELPDELASLRKLNALCMRDNQLTGHIPYFIYGFNRIETLELSGNNWTGCIPRALFNVRWNDLAEINLPVCDR